MITTRNEKAREMRRFRYIRHLKHLMNERAKLLFANFLFTSPPHSGFISLFTDNLYRIWEIHKNLHQ